MLGTTRAGLDRRAPARHPQSMAWLRVAILFCCAALFPSVAEAKMKPGVRRPFIIGAATGGAALGVHIGAAVLSLKQESWRPCIVHCDDPLARPANLAVPLALASASMLGVAMGREGYAEGHAHGASKGDRGIVALGVVSLALGVAGLVSVGKIVETKCAKRCPGIAMAEIPLGMIAVTGVTAIAFGLGKRAGKRAHARVMPTIAIGRTPTIGISGRW